MSIEYRRLAIAAGIAGALTGCGMSQSVYQRLSDEVWERNEERYRRAEVELRAKGYVFADEEVLVAMLADDGPERCVQAALDGMPPDAADMVVRFARPGVELSVAAKEACRFFGGTTEQLEGLRQDGSAAYIIPIEDEVRPARDRRGQLVVVAISRRVVSRRSVLVDRSCNRMPGPDPERTLSLRHVVLATAPPPRIEMVVPDQEELDVTCTDESW